MAQPQLRQPQPKSKKKPKPRRRHYGRYALLTLAGLVLAAGAATTYYWRASLPELNGRVALPGLKTAADVYRDAHGVPHIFAGSRNDALRVLGYMHASERFFQMEMNRRAGQGRLAEVVGKDMLATDKFLRALDVYRLAEKSYATFSPGARAALATPGPPTPWLRTDEPPSAPSSGQVPVEAGGSRGTEGVGEASTRSVVMGSMLIISSDVILVKIIFFFYPQVSG